MSKEGALLISQRDNEVTVTARSLPSPLRIEKARKQRSQKDYIGKGMYLYPELCQSQQ